MKERERESERAREKERERERRAEIAEDGKTRVGKIERDSIYGTTIGAR